MYVSTLYPAEMMFACCTASKFTWLYNGKIMRIFHCPHVLFSNNDASQFTNIFVVGILIPGKYHSRVSIGQSRDSIETLFGLRAADFVIRHMGSGTQKQQGPH